MTAAVRHNRLEHRADIAAFEGTWSQLLTGLNDTMAAFAELEGRRERAERELSDFFQLSVDLLCIGNFDGYFTRVNPAFEQTLGYTSAELTSRPFVEFAHPDDRELTAEAFASQTRGNELIGFENRYICSDGSRSLASVDRSRAARGGVRLRGRARHHRAAAQRGGAGRVATGRDARRAGRLAGRDILRGCRGGRAALRRRSRGRLPLFAGAGGDPRRRLERPRHRRSRSAHLSRSWAPVSACGCFDTQRPARMERFEGPPGSMAAFFASCGARSGVGAPITVEGRLWGVLVIVSTDPDRLPAGSELRTAQFTDLLATAVANAEAREALRRVADEQAALRRVATQVAAAAQPDAVFAGVAEEVGRLLSVDRAYVARYDADDAVTVVAAWSATGETLPLGHHWPDSRGQRERAGA